MLMGIRTKIPINICHHNQCGWWGFLSSLQIVWLFDKQNHCASSDVEGNGRLQLHRPPGAAMTKSLTRLDTVRHPALLPFLTPKSNLLLEMTCPMPILETFVIPILHLLHLTSLSPPAYPTARAHRFLLDPLAKHGHALARSPRRQGRCPRDTPPRSFHHLRWVLSDLLAVQQPRHQGPACSGKFLCTQLPSSYHYQLPSTLRQLLVKNGKSWFPKSWRTLPKYSNHCHLFTPKFMFASGACPTQRRLWSFPSSTSKRAHRPTLGPSWRMSCWWKLPLKNKTLDLTPCNFVTAQLCVSESPRQKIAKYKYCNPLKPPCSISISLHIGHAQPWPSVSENLPWLVRCWEVRKWPATTTKWPSMWADHSWLSVTFCNYI